MRALAALGGPASSDAATAPLGIVYATPPFAAHLAELVDLLRARSDVAHWTGGIGQGVCANTTEYGGEAALALMVVDLPRDGFRVFSGRQPAPPREGPGAQPALRASAALVHADPDTPDLAELVADMAARTESGFQFGAIVGADAGLPSQVADGALSGGLSGVVFGVEVPLLSRVTQGCAPLAGEHRISECSDQLIQALDGRPALDVLLDDLGVSPPVKRSLDGDEILRALPADRLRGGLLVGLAVEGGRGIGFGDYLVRNVVGIDPRNRLLAIAGAPREGDRAVFCTRDPETARRDLVRACTELRSELEESGSRPRAALYHCCVARGENLFGERGAEIELIRRNLGEVPLIGVYANGEIVRDRIYGYTGVLTLIM
ncbi:MAG TPA: FIST C-terminal domain-containing protein [Quisquiliibacterium sp.]|nr:FIST C-terminal domain-containing protein [Quisquiliibacterium sp.]